MRHCLSAVVAVLVCVASARAEVKLFAKYDWKDGAKDVAGGAIRNDGELEPGASIVGGKLVLNGWDGVVFGTMPHLNGAKQAMLRFEDVTFNQFAPDGTDPASHYATLAGDGANWWVGVAYEFRPDVNTAMQFVVCGSGFSWAVVSENATVPHFDSIEFKMDSTAPLGQRYGIRWNDGPWMLGGQGNEMGTELPQAEHFRINDGGPSDWEPIYATLGTVSLYSDVVVPEPVSWAPLAVVGMGLGMRRGRRV